LQIQDPAEFVSAYWKKIDHGQFELAWDDLSYDFQNRNHNNSYQGYLDGYQQMDLCSVRADDVRTVEQYTMQSVVTATITYDIGANCQSAAYTFHFYLLFKSRKNTWAIDRVSSILSPTILSDNAARCNSAKGAEPLVVSTVEGSPPCVVYPVGSWEGSEFDRFVLNGQAWTWLRPGCEYRLDDDSGDPELRIDYSPKLIRNIVGSVDYVLVTCH
jgi:hypothetical protein